MSLWNGLVLMIPKSISPFNVGFCVTEIDQFDQKFIKILKSPQNQN